MKNRLITTNISYLFSTDDNNILLGEWCLINNEILKSGKFKHRTLDYHYNKPNKVKTDYEYLNSIYPRILDALVKFLNNYHSTNYSYRYWEIIIAPTVVHLLSILRDRWELLENALDSEIINHIPIIDYEAKDFLSQDFYNLYTQKCDSHFWNNCVFSEIIKSSFKVKIFKIRNKIFLNENKCINQHLDLQNKYSKLKNILGKFQDKENILFYRFDLSKTNLIKYFLNKKQIIISNNEFFKKISLENKNIKRNFKLDFDAKNNFEKMLSNVILKFFPVSHLEGFKKIQIEASKINLKPKYIATIYGHVINDLFKVWVAEKVETHKSKLIISVHGGHVENILNFNSIFNISDIFISWENLNHKKAFQLPPLNFDLKLNNNKNNNKNILFCTSDTKIYAYRIHDDIISSQMVEYLKFWESLFLTMHNKIKSNIVIRHNPNSDPWNQKKKLDKLFDHNSLSKKKKFSDELKKARIVINTSMQSTFFESMIFGTPTLVLLKNDLWNLSDRGKSIYDKLKENNIIFNNVHDLNKHLEKIIDAPDIWWNSKQIQIVRNEFHNHYCKLGSFKEWIDFFSKLSSEDFK